MAKYQSAENWRRKNLKRVARKAKQWRAANKANVKATNKRYRDTNPAMAMFHRAKNGAKSRGIAFLIEFDDIGQLPTHCPVLGIPLFTSSYSGQTNKNPNEPSLDRINNERPYEPGNIQIISWRANSLKKDANLTEIEKLYFHMKRQEADDRST